MSTVTTEIDPQHLEKPLLGEQYQPGSPFPQGATWDGKGVNFALFSEASESAELCLFNRADQPQENERIQLLERTKGVWHIYIPGLGPGQRYGYRVTMLLSTVAAFAFVVSGAKRW